MNMKYSNQLRCPTTAYDTATRNGMIAIRKFTAYISYCLLMALGPLLLPLLSSVSFAEDDAFVYTINIRDEIGSGIRVYISNGMEKAKEANADAIIFDVDTPGGRVDSAVEIIREIQGTEVPTIAYVNRQAISAGAMISIACDQIVMASGGTIGDSAPVSLQGEEAGEKAVSYIRGTIEATAERQGRNPHIAVAMVDKKRVLVRFVDGEIIALRPDAYESRKEVGEEMEIIADENELLTLTTGQAFEYDFINGRADSIDELLAMYQIVEIDGTRTALTKEAIVQKQAELGNHRVIVVKSLEGASTGEALITLADRIVIFITRPMISSLLLSLGMLGLFIEIRTPGFGVPGMIGLLCVGLFFGGHMLSQIAAEWAALAFVLGIGLIVVEIFVIPGFGVAGIAGLVLMLGSGFYMLKSAYELEMAVLSLSLTILSTLALAVVALYTLPKTRAWKHFILATEMGAELGYHSAGDDDFQGYVGKTGRAHTPLRPAGTILIGNKRLDVLTSGDFISSESLVTVVAVEGSKIFVEAVDEVTT